MDARIFGITSLVFLTAWMSPAKIQRVDFRSISSVAPIVIDKSSPAAAALEDSREYYLERPGNNIENYSPKKLVLVSIHKKNIEPAAPVEVRKLNVAVIRQGKQVDHLAQLIANTLEDPPAPTANELAEILVREELARRSALGLKPTQVREIATISGQNILVSKPVFINAANYLKKSSPPTVAAAPVNPKRVIVQRPAKVQPPSRAHEDVAKNDFGVGSISTLSVNPSTPKKYVISGPLTFSGGVAFLGNRNSVTANQMIDGLPMSEGLVDIKDASYEISVEELDGNILAEVRNQDGQIMGQGQVNLRNLNPALKNVARLRDIPLEVRPVFNGVSGVTVSAASYGKNKYIVSDAKVYVAGLSREIIHNKNTMAYEDDTLAMPSTYVLRGAHEKFWPTLSFAESGEKFQLRLFPNGLVDALLSLSLTKYEAREAKNQAVVWGRISMSGRPIEGAQIFIIGDNNNQPNYFNGFLPDKTKTATASHGEFAFTRVKERETLLRVSFAGKLLLPTLVPTENRHVTYADLEIESERMVDIKNYDAFDLNPLPAALQPMGTKENIYISESGGSQLRLNTVKGITLIESDAGEPYVVSRALLKSGQTELHFPQIKKAWLEGIHKQGNQTEEAKEIPTSIVSFVNGDNYQVLIGDGSSEKNPNIIYFDSNGVIVGDSGISGGGFAVFGLPQGLNTVTIVPEKSKKVVTQTVYVDEFATGISRINLMF